MILVLEVYKNQLVLKDYLEISDFYDYYSGLQEFWDGFVLLVFSDGKIVGVGLDWNGLWFVCYCIIKDDYIVLGFEVGVVDLLEVDIVEKGCLVLG